MAKLTTKEAAQRLGITPTRIQQLILDNKLPAEKFGRDWMIEEEALAGVQVYGRPGRPPKQGGEKMPQGRTPKQLAQDLGSATIKASNRRGRKGKT